MCREPMWVRTLNESTICFRRLREPPKGEGRLEIIMANDERFQLISLGMDSYLITLRVFFRLWCGSRSLARYEYISSLHSSVEKAFRRGDRFIVNYFIELSLTHSLTPSSRFICFEDTKRLVFDVSPRLALPLCSGSQSCWQIKLSFAHIVT